MTDWPDSRWGSETSILRRPAVAFSSTRTDRDIRVFRLEQASDGAATGA